jgi:hypothetical protein
MANKVVRLYCTVKMSPGRWSPQPIDGCSSLASNNGSNLDSRSNPGRLMGVDQFDVEDPYILDRSGYYQGEDQGSCQLPAIVR